MTEQRSSDEPPSPSGGGYPVYRSHYRPRTKSGWIAAVAFLALLALTQPPLVYALANRTEPWLLGLPFLYSYLLVIYCLMIVVLVWAQRRNV